MPVNPAQSKVGRMEGVTDQKMGQIMLESASVQRIHVYPWVGSGMYVCTMCCRRGGGPKLAGSLP